jgi:CRP-like cAMP-binding protein
MDAKGILKHHIAKTASLTDEQFDYFFSHFKKQSFQKGQAIITERVPVDCEYFVISGCLKSFFINDDLKMFILQFAMPTWWASDYNALYNHTKAIINVDCITDAEVLCLTNGDRKSYVAKSIRLNIFSGGGPTEDMLQRKKGFCLS